jgi:hypothetical protein
LGRSCLCLHLLYNLHRLHTDGADPLQQINDGLLVINKAVGVELVPNGRVAGVVSL